MCYNKYSRGSEWRKWDLHIHTPESILENKFNTSWDEYVKRMFKLAIQEDIRAIGITDYYFIDGYKKLKNEYLSNESKLKELFGDDEILKIKNILVFPNIEFRINKLVIGKEIDLKWNKKVNFHVLFSDELTPEDIEENFINKLKFEDKGDTDDIPQERSLTKRNLNDLGERLIKEQQSFESHDPLQVGMLCASVDDKDIVKILRSQKEIFKGKYLLALPADEDLSEVSWKSQGHLSRKVLYQKSHIVFSSNQGTIDFSLGKRHDSIEQFKKEFGNQKPCLWGSDAHSFDKLFKPDNNKYTWIKSDPSFEGLKQVVFEPEERVKIQENIPEEKTPYLVIDKVRYIDETLKNTFPKSWIEFNQNLNTIIGGKSSGKSLLLYHIAKSIDSEEVLRKTKLVKDNNYQKFITENPFNFEVLWTNGDKDELKSAQPSDSQITYIPQLYINHLAEEKGEQQLEDLIDSILKQNSNYKIFYDKTFTEIQDCKIRITKAIDERLIHYASYKKLKKEISEIGRIEKVKLEIERLTKEIEKLNKESGFNQHQNLEFRRLTNFIHSLNHYIIECESTINSLNNYSSFIGGQFENFKTNSKRKILEFKNNKIEEYLIEQSNMLINEHIEKNLKYFSKQIQNIILKLQSKQENYKTRLEELELKIKPLQQRVKNQELLIKLNKELKEQQSKITLIEKTGKEIKSVAERGKAARDDIFEYYDKLFACYKNINIELKKKEYSQIDKDIKLQSTLIFDCNKFEKFSELFDNRVKLNSYFLRIFNEKNEFIYIEETHLQAIKQIFQELKNGENENIKLKSNINIDDLFYRLFDNYFKIDYQIIYKGENILEMSPGKKGLVLLQLILHISKAKHPILIDQPEDNLDNRTIYDELKAFIKNKKQDRQIIIVSHNANIVVSTDAENTIVANQAGQNKNSDKRKYQFEYVSGGIEHSFINEEEKGVLYQKGIREHICEILEGGKEAFEKRENKYGFK